jgi:hypothetical protein
MRGVWQLDDNETRFLGFFVPPPEDGEDLEKFYKAVTEEINSQIWLICMTLQGWSHSEVMLMSEQDRLYWVKTCEEYQEKLKEDLDRAKH